MQKRKTFNIAEIAGQNAVRLKTVFRVVGLPKYYGGEGCTIKPFGLLKEGNLVSLSFNASEDTGRGGNGHYAPKLAVARLSDNGGVVIARGDIYVSQLHTLLRRGLRLKEV